MSSNIDYPVKSARGDHILKKFLELLQTYQKANINPSIIHIILQFLGNVYKLIDVLLSQYNYCQREFLNKSANSNVQPI